MLESRNLIYRKLTIDDVDGIYELDSISEVHRYLGNNPIQSKEKAKEIIEYVISQYEKNGIGRYAAIEKSSGDFIGWTGLKLEDKKTNGITNYYDIGYRFIPRYWQKGYGFESAKFWLDYGFDVLKYDKISGAAHHENIGSNKILQRIGLKFTNSFIYDGAKHNWYELKSIERRNNL